MIPTENFCEKENMPPEYKILVKNIEKSGKKTP